MLMYQAVTSSSYVVPLTPTSVLHVLRFAVLCARILDTYQIQQIKNGLFWKLLCVYALDTNS